MHQRENGISERKRKRKGKKKRMSKIDTTGRLFIPRKIRNILNLRNGDAVEIHVRDDEEIVIKRANRPVKDESESTKQYFKIPVEWSSAGIVRVKAETLEDAVKKFDSIRKKIDSESAENIEMVYGTFDRIKDVNNPMQYYKDMQKFW